MVEIKHSAQRNYTKAKGTAYSLPHDAEERHRLTVQSNLLLRTYDNKVLHAPVKLTDKDWVLDIGTGSGIWLQDLARQVPAKPQYIGADMEPALFPDPSTLPPNMRFEVHSVTNLPAEWTNKFTVVHQRLLIAGLREHEWRQAIREMYRVLKPGGWVQLFEMEVWLSGPALAKHVEMLYRLADKQGTLWRDLTKRIPDFLKESGFINLYQDVRKTPLGAWAGQDGDDGKENLLGIMRGLKTPMLANGGLGLVSSEAEYDRLLEETSEEFDSTQGSGTTWVMFWAQKAEETAVGKVRSRL